MSEILGKDFAKMNNSNLCYILQAQQYIQPAKKVEIKTLFQVDVCWLNRKEKTSNSF